MGYGYSTPENTIVSSQEINNDVSKIVNDALKEEPMIDTAPMVKEDVVSLESALNAIAAQVYDDVHRQISEYQSKHLGASEELVNNIKGKLRPPSKSEGQCKIEESQLLECLKNSASPTECSSIVNKYHLCALMAFQNKE